MICKQRILYFILLVPFGCAGLHLDHYGRLSADSEVTTVFERYQVDPDSYYYISGPDCFPNAIIGVNRAYVLETTLWKKLEMMPAVLQKLVKNMRTQATIHQGFSILDTQGKKIGIWYSIPSAATYVRMKDQRSVIIPTPHIDAYDKSEKRLFPGIQ